jgi:hypothetical protein
VLATTVCSLSATGHVLTVTPDDSTLFFVRAGNDVLFGGPGGDSLDGGPDSDTCVQGPGSGLVTHCEH